MRGLRQTTTRSSPLTPDPSPPSTGERGAEGRGPASFLKSPQPQAAVGKAILFAREALVFPNWGPWSALLNSPIDPLTWPTFADIPGPGQRIEAGRPILTFFTHAETSSSCLEQLRLLAGQLERELYR